jgi:murein DD-endopeptidase MepM/ murein hydrolase activator NlpD
MFGKKKDISKKASFKAKINSVIRDLNNFYKNRIVYRLFWGRTDLYKKLIHSFVLILTISIIITGFTAQISSQSTKQNVITTTDISSGNVDLLEQGGSVQSILRANSTIPFTVITHKVKKGETFEAIAKKYNVKEESVKLSNLGNIDYYSDKPEEGKTLIIPEINGLILKVGKGDTLDKVVKKLTKGKKKDIIEINALIGPDYKLPEGEYILIPDGAIQPPARPQPQPTYYYASYNAPPGSVPSGGSIGNISFGNPLSNPGCGGYSYSRGVGWSYGYWHNGIDLAKGGGCPIRSIADGVVEFAGWSSGGEGFMVRVNHGNGVKSLYFHGNGTFWVSPGTKVSKGQDIMYMGCTGLCTGTHLHISLKYNEVWIDPAPYVPF